MFPYYPVLKLYQKVTREKVVGGRTRKVFFFLSFCSHFHGWLFMIPKNVELTLSFPDDLMVCSSSCLLLVNILVVLVVMEVRMTCDSLMKEGSEISVPCCA